MQCSLQCMHELLDDFFQLLLNSTTENTTEKFRNVLVASTDILQYMWAMLAVKYVICKTESFISKIIHKNIGVWW